MTETERFLLAYKRLETVLLRSPVRSFESVLSFEYSLKDKELQDKLKTCRIIRNYIAHHEDGAKVFPASSAMTRFLKGLSDSLEKQETLKMAASPAMLLSDNSTLRDCLDGFSKQKGERLYLPYRENATADDRLYVLSSNIVFDLYGFQDYWGNVTPSKLLKTKIVSAAPDWIQPAIVADGSEPVLDYVSQNKTEPIVLCSDDTYQIIQPGTLSKRS
jgi:hypothetical protein